MGRARFQYQGSVSKGSLKAIAFHKHQLRTNPPNALQYKYQLSYGSGRAASQILSKSSLQPAVSVNHVPDVQLHDEIPFFSRHAKLDMLQVQYYQPAVQQLKISRVRISVVYIK
ncbi:hypothetical protein VTK26DRAFT_3948 [Humicola hyalothermophila]